MWPVLYTQTHGAGPELPLAWEPMASLLRDIFPMTSSWLKQKIRCVRDWPKGNLALTGQSES